MTHPADDMVQSIFGGLPSRWDERRRRQLALRAYWRGSLELHRKAPRGGDFEDDQLAVALGVLAAHFGY